MSIIEDIKSQINILKIKIEDLESQLHFVVKEKRIKELEQQMSISNFWNNQKVAKQISQELADLKNELKTWQDLSSEIKVLSELIQDEDSSSLEQELANKFYDLNKKYQELEISVLLSGKYDSNNAVLSIYAGAGGDDAQDWAEMLMRMYLRYSENKKWQTNIIDQSKGSEAGIKSATIEISGKNVYGYLKAESGVHRLVRLSPFDADKARHTSFAMVEVIPEIETETDFELKDEDLKIEANTATGHGGQSVNTTYSAIRITHLPTGIKVNCQNERSQAQNKETAFKILKGRLSQYYEAKADEERQRLRGEFTEAAWGNQIRSYVLHPYKMVKDHRTNYEESDPDKVLDGNLDKFIEVYLKSQIE